MNRLLLPPEFWLCLSLCSSRLVVAQTAPCPIQGLMGTVKSSDGKPLEGVPVSAKAQGSTITTSVYTNQNGEYYFPPLPAGQYRISAQAVGFELTRAEQTISSDKKIQRLRSQAIRRTPGDSSRMPNGSQACPTTPRKIER